MSVRPAAVAAALLSIGLAACVSHVRYPLEGRFLKVSRAPALEMFAYAPGTADEVELHDARRQEHGYATWRFSMPGSFENGQPGNRLTGTYYDSGLPGRKPLVIVLPVWGVSEYPSTMMTRAILRRSGGRMNVLRVDGRNRLMAWKNIEHSATADEFISRVSNSAKRLKHAVIDVRRLIDWARTRGEVDNGRIGLVGFSVSAVSGTLVMQSDSRVKSGALIMGGAMIGKIVSECPGNEQSTREAVIRNLGFSVVEYERTVTALFEGLDPTDYPNRVNPGSILITDAGKDDCIPREARDAWWEALGRPERLSFNYDHRRSFLSMTPLGFNFLRRRIYEHLERTL